MTVLDEQPAATSATVVDFHTHVIPPSAYLPEVVELVERMNPGYAARFADGYPTAAEFVADLRTSGVSRAVVLAEHARAASGHLSSEWVSEYCQDFPELVPACSINPNTDPDARALFTHYVHGLGFRLCKLLPSYQFVYPNEPRMYRIYEIAESASVIVMIHVGSSVFQGTRARYCHPAHIEEVARDFPALQLVLCHAGRGYWYEQCAFMASHLANVHLDIAGLPPSRLLQHFPDLERIAGKVLFGSDWPAMPASIAANAAQIRALPLAAQAVEAILHGNAERLLGNAGLARV
jgi:predicted TIM-barrel fold metal-dependent hydrolase